MEDQLLLPGKYGISSVAQNDFLAPTQLCRTKDYWTCYQLDFADGNMGGNVASRPPLAGW
jgi:hypothetical protein